LEYRSFNFPPVVANIDALRAHLGNVCRGDAMLRKAAFLAGLFLLCGCVLILQIVETRILSVISFYHLAFFAISMAMFGMTAGALIVYFNQDFFCARAPARALELDRCGVRAHRCPLDRCPDLNGAPQLAGKTRSVGNAVAQADSGPAASLPLRRHGHFARIDA
jgi:hypothetical protein